MLPLDVAPVIQEFNVGPLTVERRVSPTQNAYGGYDTGPAVDVVFDPIAVHPSLGRTLLQSAPADRTPGQQEFYALQRFFTADDGQVPDVITFRGRRYRCTGAIHDYEEQGGVYIAFGQLEDVQALP